MVQVPYIEIDIPQMTAGVLLLYSKQKVLPSASMTLPQQESVRPVLDVAF
jgi:hypothetical protein